MKPRLLLGLPLCLAFTVTALAAAQPDRPKGITMRIIQEMNLGDLSCDTDCRAQFLPPQNFRIDGTMFLRAFEMKMKMTITGNGTEVRQLTETPFGPKAVVIDLAKVQGAIPGYSPASDYDPAAYKKMLDGMPDKRTLPPETLDGVKVEVYEFSPRGMKLPLPSNMQLGVPDPAKVRAWVNPTDGILRKLEIEDDQGTVFLRMLYQNVKTGVSIPAETFDMAFPEGVTPVDMTQIILNGVAGAGRRTEGVKGAVKSKQ